MLYTEVGQGARGIVVRWGTSRKAAGSIADVVIGFFQLT
jgi:hypothetical protein